MAAGRELVCVFGCGGDRDPGKRPEMGAIAARLADRIVVTTDNPRGEDPEAIASAVVKGIREVGNRRWSIEHDRARRDPRRDRRRQAGDLVLVAGKGHETYQERNGVRSAVLRRGGSRRRARRLGRRHDGHARPPPAPCPAA